MANNASKKSASKSNVSKKGVDNDIYGRLRIDYTSGRDRTQHAKHRNAQKEELAKIMEEDEGEEDVDEEKCETDDENDEDSKDMKEMLPLRILT